MHDLDTLTQMNAIAFEQSVLRKRSEGLHVAAKYANGALNSYESFATEAEAQAVPGSVYLGPLPGFYAAARDQSEDRQPTVLCYQMGPNGLVSSPVNEGVAK